MLGAYLHLPFPREECVDWFIRLRHQDFPRLLQDNNKRFQLVDLLTTVHGNLLETTNPERSKS